MGCSFSSSKRPPRLIHYSEGHLTSADGRHVFHPEAPGVTREDIVAGRARFATQPVNNLPGLNQQGGPPFSRRGWRRSRNKRRGYRFAQGQQHFGSQGQRAFQQQQQQQQWAQQNAGGSNFSATQAAGKTKLGGKPFPEIDGIPIDSPQHFHRNAGPRGAGPPPPTQHRSTRENESSHRDSRNNDRRDDRHSRDRRQGGGTGEGNPLDGWDNRSRNWAARRQRPKRSQMKPEPLYE